MSDIKINSGANNKLIEKTYFRHLDMSSADGSGLRRILMSNRSLYDHHFLAETLAEKINQSVLQTFFLSEFVKLSDIKSLSATQDQYISQNRQLVLFSDLFINALNSNLIVNYVQFFFEIHKYSDALIKSIYSEMHRIYRIKYKGNSGTSDTSSFDRQLEAYLEKALPNTFRVISGKIANTEENFTKEQKTADWNSFFNACVRSVDNVKRPEKIIDFTQNSNNRENHIYLDRLYILRTVFNEVGKYGSYIGLFMLLDLHKNNNIDASRFLSKTSDTLHNQAASFISSLATINQAQKTKMIEKLVSDASIVLQNTTLSLLIKFVVQKRDMEIALLFIRENTFNISCFDIWKKRIESDLVGWFRIFELEIRILLAVGEINDRYSDNFKLDKNMILTKLNGLQTPEEYGIQYNKLLTKPSQEIMKEFIKITEEPSVDTEHASSSRSIKRQKTVSDNASSDQINSNNFVKKQKTSTGFVNREVLDRFITDYYFTRDEETAKERISLLRTHIESQKCIRKLQQHLTEIFDNNNASVSELKPQELNLILDETRKRCDKIAAKTEQLQYSKYLESAKAISISKNLLAVGSVNSAEEQNRSLIATNTTTEHNPVRKI